LIELRKQLLPLRRGRQVLHQISGDGAAFDFPHCLGDRIRSLVSWSRLFIDQEILIAINTDETNSVTAYSAVAPTFRLDGDQLARIFWYAPNPAEPPPSSLSVERRSGLLAVQMTLPPAGFVIYKAAPGLHRLTPNEAPATKTGQVVADENGAHQRDGQVVKHVPVEIQ
jgi:hypothetical protein